MAKPRVLFASQIVKKDQPLELVPAKGLSFKNGLLELYEMDSFLQNGKRIVETRKKRSERNNSLIGRFQVEVVDGRYSKVEMRPLLSRGRGVYHGWWGDLRLTHYVDMPTLQGSWRGAPLTGGFATSETAGGLGDPVQLQKAIRGRRVVAFVDDDEVPEIGRMAGDEVPTSEGWPASKCKQQIGGDFGGDRST